MKLGFKVLISAALLAVVFYVVPWTQVRDAAGRVSPGAWAVVLAGFVAGHLLGVVKWRRFVNVGRAGLRPLDAVLCYAAGLFANLCLPSIVGGDLLRLGLAGRITRRPEAALWGGVMDRVTDVLALTALATTGGLLARQHLTGWTSGLLTAALIVGLVGAATALPLALRRPIKSWPRRLRRPVARALVAARRLWRRPSVALGGITLSLAIQSSFVLLNAWLGRQLGIQVGLAVWFLAWPLAKVASLFPISLGGLAVREASLATVLLPFGVPAALAIVCSLLWQTVLIAGGLLGGLTWLALSRIRHLPVRVTPASAPSAAR